MGLTPLPSVVLASVKASVAGQPVAAAPQPAKPKSTTAILYREVIKFSRKDNKLALGGVCLRSDGQGSGSLVASDGHVLYWQEVQTAAPRGEHVLRAPTGSKVEDVDLDTPQLILEGGAACPPVDSQYPNVAALFKKQPPAVSYLLDRKKVAAWLRAMKPLNPDDFCIQMVWEKGVLTMAPNGDLEEVVQKTTFPAMQCADVEPDGQDSFEILVRWNYLRDILVPLDDKIRVDYYGPLEPLFFSRDRGLPVSEVMQSHPFFVGKGAILMPATPR